jgi:AP-3 complex subunit delta-1
LNSSTYLETSLALGGLATFSNTDLARDLCSDVVSLLNSSRAYIRKKAILALYKIFLKFPDALRPSFPKLKEKLDDPDPCKLFGPPYSISCKHTREVSW